MKIKATELDLTIYEREGPREILGHIRLPEEEAEKLRPDILAANRIDLLSVELLSRQYDLIGIMFDVSATYDRQDKLVELAFVAMDFKIIAK